MRPYFRQNDRNRKQLISLRPEAHKRTLANSADPDQMLQNAASDQGLQFALNTGFSLKRGIKDPLYNVNICSPIKTNIKLNLLFAG